MTCSAKPLLFPPVVPNQTKICNNSSSTMSVDSYDPSKDAKAVETAAEILHQIAGNGRRLQYVRESSRYLIREIWGSRIRARIRALLNDEAFQEAVIRREAEMCGMNRNSKWVDWPS